MSPSPKCPCAISASVGEAVSCRVGVLAHQIFSENVVGEYTHSANAPLKRTK